MRWIYNNIFEVTLIVMNGLVPMAGVLLFEGDPASVVWVFWFDIVISCVFNIISLFRDVMEGNSATSNFAKSMGGIGFFIGWYFAITIGYFGLLKLLINNAGIRFEITDSLMYVGDVLPLLVPIVVFEFFLNIYRNSQRNTRYTHIISTLIGQVGELLVFASLYIVGYLLVLFNEAPISLVIFIGLVRIIAGIIKLRLNQVKWPLLRINQV